MEWISVKDRVPSKTGRYWVSFKDKTVDIGIWNGHGGDRNWYYEFGCMCDHEFEEEVLYWSPTSEFWPEYLEPSIAEEGE